MFSNAGKAIDSAVRASALLAFVAALLILLTHWAVRRRSLQPFGWWPRFVRKWSDPFVRPIERSVASRGGNPQDAPLWLLGVVLVLGLLAISAVRWVTGAVAVFDSMRHAGLRAWLHLTVVAASSLLLFAIIVRVIGSWLGAGRYNRWIRPAYLLTDWIIEPLRRRLPSFGPIDLSPFVAYILILVLRGLLLGVL
ncbi:MAG TPA: YggT family protein [Gemmatimonadales bacterium]|jgi:YggT family protein|nr:YggT family protein [Gemmatimonadales bacterium]